MKQIITTGMDLEVGKLYYPGQVRKEITPAFQIYVCVKKTKVFVTVYNLKHNTYTRMRCGDLIYMKELTE